MDLPAGTTLSRPAPAPARGWAELGTWFEAATPFGPLHLYAGDAAGAARHAAEAALVLARCEDFLAGLDDWLPEPPDWRWSPSPGPGEVGAAQCRLQWRDSCHQLMGPWAWLRSLPAPPAAFAARLNWPAVEVVLSAAQLRLGTDELHQLEPGGAVLLPQSLQPGWIGHLRGAAEPTQAPHGVPVALVSPTTPRLIAGPALATASIPGDPTGTLCEIRLAPARALGADHLAGWRDEVLAGLLHHELAASLWSNAAGREPARCLAHGRLMPWGDGWALALQGMGEAEQGHMPEAFPATLALGA